MKNIIKQILIGSILGDGHITSAGVFQTGSKYKDWITFKANILSKYTSDRWYNFVPENGYSQTPYHTFRTLVSKDIKKIHQMTLPELLANLDEIGLAVWFYDDGSLHQEKLFYNLNTHSFTEQEHKRYIVPALFRFNIKPTLTSEIKKDGRKFWYIRINKKDGAENINALLKKYPMPCYAYKTYSGNINKTIARPLVQLKKVSTGKIILLNNITQACRHIKSYRVKLLEVIDTNITLKGYVLSRYYI